MRHLNLMKLTYQEYESSMARCEAVRDELAKNNNTLDDSTLAEYIINLVKLGDSWNLREIIQNASITVKSTILLRALNTAFDYEANYCADIIREHLDKAMYRDIRGELTDESVTTFCNTNHLSLVQYAVVKNKLDLLDQLHKAGSMLNAQNQYGLSAIHLAVLHGNEKMVRELLLKGANPNLQDSNGWTPLFMAVYTGKKEIAQLLLANGANPCIKSYDGETLFHARERRNSRLSEDKKMRLSDLIPITPELAAQQNDIDCFRRQAAYYREAHQLVNVKQKFVIDKFDQYHGLSNQDKSLISRGGYCNGFAFYTNYLDSCGRIDEHEKILEAFVQWDGTNEMLDQPLAGTLATYGTRRRLFEEYIGQLTFFFDPSRLEHTGVRQHHRDIQLAAMGELNSISSIFRQTNPAVSLTRSQLVEFLTFLQQLPANSRFELTGSEHAVSFKINTQKQFEYWDSEFPTAKPAVLDNPSAFANHIIKAKYADLGKPVQYSAQGEPIVSDIRFQGYHYAREHVPMSSFNYFTQGRLPVTKESTDNFIAASSLGFSPMHYVVLSNSKDNFSQLLDLPFAKEMLTRGAPQSFGESPLTILFDTRNPEMLDVFLQKAHQLGFESNFVQDKLLAILERYAEIRQFENIRRFAHQLDDAHCKDFMIHMCYQDHPAHVMDEVLKIIPLDKSKHSKAVHGLLNDDYVSTRKKDILKKHFFSEHEKLSVGKHAVLFAQDTVQKPSPIPASTEAQDKQIKKIK